MSQGRNVYKVYFNNGSDTYDYVHIWTWASHSLTGNSDMWVRGFIFTTTDQKYTDTRVRIPMTAIRMVESVVEGEEAF